MKKDKKTKKKLSLDKLQMTKLTNLNVIKGGAAEGNTGYTTATKPTIA